AAANDVKEARTNLENIKAKLPADLKEALYKKAKAEQLYQGIKANYDSFMSLLNEAVDERDQFPRDDSRWKILDGAVTAKLQQVQKLENDLKQAQLALDQADKTLKALQKTQRDVEDRLSRAEDDL